MGVNHLPRLAKYIVRIGGKQNITESDQALRHPAASVDRPHPGVKAIPVFIPFHKVHKAAAFRIAWQTGSQLFFHGRQHGLIGAQFSGVQLRIATA